jgi:hypothetical protein
MNDCVSETMVTVAVTPQVDNASDAALAQALRRALVGCAGERVSSGVRCHTEGCFTSAEGRGYRWETVVGGWLERCWQPEGAVC